MTQNHRPCSGRDWREASEALVRYLSRNKAFPSAPGACRYCGNTIVRRRGPYCSRGCHIACDVACGWALRYYVKTRDHGVCRDCGLDCTELDAELKEWRRHGIRRECLCANNVPLYNSTWEVHHIHAVVEGGRTTMENLVTLCWRCHARYTKALAGKLAKVKGGDGNATLH